MLSTPLKQADTQPCEKTGPDDDIESDEDDVHNLTQLEKILTLAEVSYAHLCN